MFKISDGTYKEFECCLSTDRHFTRAPCKIDCGHYCCKSCWQTSYGKKLKCTTCQTTILLPDPESDEPRSPYKVDDGKKNKMKENIQELLKIVSNQFKESINSFKDKFEKFDSNLDIHLQYLRDEIEIRILSIKDELDIMQSNYFRQLDDIRTDLIKDNEEKLNAFKVEIETYENYYNKTKNEVSNQTVDFFEYQKKLQSFNLIQNKLRNYKYELDFESSKNFATRNLVGFINYKKKVFDDYDGCLFRSRISSLEENNAVEIDVYKICELHHRRCKPYATCVLPNDTVVVSNYTYGLMLMDKYFTRAIPIDTSDSNINLNCSTISIATNNVDKVYIAQLNTHEVVMTDLNLKIIKTIGGYGDRDLRLRNDFDDSDKGRDFLAYPTSVVYYKGLVYVCDHRNNKIQVYTENLDYFDTLKILFKPYQLCIGNDLIAVTRNDKSENILYFYTLNPFEFKVSYNKMNVNISVINSQFYGYAFETKSLHCFDQNGKFIEEIRMKFLENYDSRNYKNEYEERLDGFIFQIDDDYFFTHYERSLYYRF